MASKRNEKLGGNKPIIDNDGHGESHRTFTGSFVPPSLGDQDPALKRRMDVNRLATCDNPYLEWEPKKSDNRLSWNNDIISEKPDEEEG